MPVWKFYFSFGHFGILQLAFLCSRKYHIERTSWVSTALCIQVSYVYMCLKKAEFQRVLIRQKERRYRFSIPDSSSCRYEKLSGIAWTPFFSLCAVRWHRKLYQICDDPLSSSSHSVKETAPKSPFRHMWTEALSGMVFGPALRLSAYLSVTWWMFFFFFCLTRPVQIVLVQCWKVAFWNVKKSRRRFQKLLPKILHIFIYNTSI